MGLVGRPNEPVHLLAEPISSRVKIWVDEHEMNNKSSMHHLYNVHNEATDSRLQLQVALCT